MATMMIVTNQNQRIRKDIRTSTGFSKEMLSVKARMNQLKQSIQLRRTTACEQSTISYGQTYELIRPNLLSLTVGFYRIDAAVIKTTTNL